MVNVQLHKYATGIALALFVVFGVGLTRFPQGYIASATASSRTTTVTQTSSGITSTSFTTASWNETAGSTTYGYYAANVAKSGTSLSFKGSNTASSRGYLYNTASGSSTISRLTSITLTQSGTTRAWNGYFGTSANPTGNLVSKTAATSITWSVTGAYNFFKLECNGGNNKNATVTSIAVTYYPCLSSIAVTTQPTTTTFYVGQTFSSSGMGITQTYDDGTTATSTGWTTDYDSHQFSSSDLGNKTVTVSYTEPSTTSVTTITKTTTYSITVAYPPLNSIYTSYTSGEGVDRYIPGDTFQSVPIYATWGYGSDTLVTSSSVFSIGGTTMTPGASTITGTGVQTVDVSYTDPLTSGTKTTSYSIYVFSIDAIAITSYPSKSVVGGTSFGLGETFTSSGLSITATYKYSGYGDITRILSSGFSLSSPNMMTLGEQSVTITYSGKTTAYTIFVSNLNKATGVTDAQQASAMATYVLSRSACEMSDADVALMVEEYDLMTSGAKVIFDAWCDHDGIVSTGTGAKDRYDYILYLYPDYADAQNQHQDLLKGLSEYDVVKVFGLLFVFASLGLFGYSFIAKGKRTN